MPAFRIKQGDKVLVSQVVATFIPRIGEAITVKGSNNVWRVSDVQYALSVGAVDVEIQVNKVE